MPIHQTHWTQSLARAPAPSNLQTSSSLSVYTGFGKAIRDKHKGELNHYSEFPISTLLVNDIIHSVNMYISVYHKIIQEFCKHCCQTNLPNKRYINYSIFIPVPLHLRLCPTVDICESLHTWLSKLILILNIYYFSDTFLMPKLVFYPSTNRQGVNFSRQFDINRSWTLLNINNPTWIMLLGRNTAQHSSPV